MDKVTCDMITEDYVSFETAKLLKEKGYNGPSVFYDEEDAYRWNSENFIEVPNPNYEPSIPFDTETFREYLPHVTLAMAMKWLREVHNLEIYPYHDMFQENNKWWYGIEKFTKGCSNCQYEEKSIYSTYEEACEAAIKYCLENLI